MRENLTRKVVAGLLLLAGVVSVASAEVRLPGVFGDHMVLQRDVCVPVWGWADPCERVTVVLGNQSKTTRADKDGKWSLRLNAMKAGGPVAMTVQGTNTVEFDDVLIGEVWLCSGQSNMWWRVRQCKDYKKEAAAAEFPQIRMMTVAQVAAETPRDNCRGRWVVCGPETVGDFSATAYYFGRELHRELGVPVGLVNSSWGGTPIEAWTCREFQQKEPKLKPLLDQWQKKTAGYDPEEAKAAYEKKLARWKEKAKKAKAAGKRKPRKPRPPNDPRSNPHRPAVLYNGMIAPLAPYAIRGSIWYQGETNARRRDAGLYGVQLGLMIENWRHLWGQGDFPFEWVQLPNYLRRQRKPSEPSGWVTVQEAMFKTLKVPNTGMAVTIDIGEARDIHPKNKQDVGKRLALWALAKTYGKDVVCCGPLYKSMAKQDEKIVLSFDHLGGGLSAKGGEKLRGFALAGRDEQFVWADAVIDAGTVVVSSAKVRDPVAVRYAWASNPAGNLSNRAGLPASPFRTDDWSQ